MDYKLEFGSPNKMTLKLMDGKKWSPAAGLIIAKSVNVGAKSYQLAGTDGDPRSMHLHACPSNLFISLVLNVSLSLVYNRAAIISVAQHTATPCSPLLFLHLLHRPSGVRVATVYTDPTIIAGKENFHETQSKVTDSLTHSTR